MLKSTFKSVILVILICSFSHQSYPMLSNGQRLVSGLGGVLLLAAMTAPAKNTIDIAKHVWQDPSAANLYWNLRLGTPPAVPMLINGLVAAGIAVLSTTLGCQALTGKNIFGKYLG
jgi:hypothetical protein